MYEAKKNDKFYVVYRNGEHKEFNNYKDLLFWLNDPHNYNNFYRNEDGPKRVEKAGNNWNDQGSKKEGVFDFPASIPIEFIVYDSYGRVINKEYLVKDLEDYVPLVPYYYKYGHNRIKNNWLGFRTGPVPYSRCRRSGPGCTGPRIIQELKRNMVEEKYARAKRQADLRYAWDWDRYKMRHYRSWKLCTRKRKQWM